MDAPTFLGIMLVCGYNRLPYRRFIGQNELIIHNSLVSDSLRRNRFDDIVTYVIFILEIILMRQVTDRPTTRFDRYLKS